MRAGLVAMACACAVGGLAACGGDDGDGGSSDSGEKKGSSSAKAPSHATVLSCLKGEGLEAEDQSNSFGKKIGIDYAAGRALVSFEKTAEDADAYASAAKSNGDTAVVKGSVAITLPDDPEAEATKSTVEGCVE